MRFAIIAAASVLVATPGGAAHAASAMSALDTMQIEQLTVFKVSVQRTDLQPTVAGVKIPPSMGLTSWAAFQGSPGHAMVMGDLVLAEDQVNPVMSVALDNGLEVTALHNHFFWESPRVMFMHIGGMGDEKVLASAVGKVFAKVKEGAYKVTIGRTTRMHGADAGNAMGVNTWAAFAGSEDRAVVDGDFAMLESELQPVLKALRGAGIDIVAIHQHMTGEQPRVLFLHYWGVGPAQSLARGLRTALDRTATRLGAR